MGEDNWGEGGFAISAQYRTFFLSRSSWPLLTERAVSVRWEPLAFSCAWLSSLVFCSHTVEEWLLTCYCIKKAFIIQYAVEHLDSGVARSGRAPLPWVLGGSGDCLPNCRFCSTHSSVALETLVSFLQVSLSVPKLTIVSRSIASTVVFLLTGQPLTLVPWSNPAALSFRLRVDPLPHLVLPTISKYDLQ